MQAFESELLTTIQAKANIIQIISYETQRIHSAIIQVARYLKCPWYSWNRIEGIKEWCHTEKKFKIIAEECRTAEFVLDFFSEREEEQCILLLEDFHPDLADHNIATIKRIRNIAISPHKKRILIFSQPHYFLPQELEKEVQILELSLPSKMELQVIFRKVCNDFHLSPENYQESETLLEAALGLTIMEAEIAFGRAIALCGQLTESEIPIIVREKENIIKKSGYLEYFHPQENMEQVGGLETLKNWLKRRGRAFMAGAREYGLDTPRGILLLGIPGTGKSLTAKAIAKAWNFPLLKLDMGRVFGGIVGQSEDNIRKALSLSETIAPCILWLDEIEKGLSGSASSGSTDGGTAARVFGTFLTWLQEKKKPVFVVATANDISQLPPELLRKGRMDEIFFTDLPGIAARREIFSIHLHKKKRSPKEFYLDILVNESKGFSGAEIEEAIKEAMFQAFDRGDELKTEDIQKALQETYPLAKTMGRDIAQLREWAKNRAKYASEEECDFSPSSEEKTPRLKQEYSNPFID